VRSEGWRYIRYADGGEELYDETKDPHEWMNLAAKPEYAATKSDLAHWLPTSNVPTPNKASTPDKKSSPNAKKQAKQAARRAARETKTAE
jgi:hypothetical protein